MFAYLTFSLIKKKFQEFKNQIQEERKQIYNQNIHHWTNKNSLQQQLLDRLISIKESLSDKYNQSIPNFDDQLLNLLQSFEKEHQNKLFFVHLLNSPVHLNKYIQSKTISFDPLQNQNDPDK